MYSYRESHTNGLGLQPGDTQPSLFTDESPEARTGDGDRNHAVNTNASETQPCSWVACGLMTESDVIKRWVFS